MSTPFDALPINKGEADARYVQLASIGIAGTVAVTTDPDGVEVLVVTPGTATAGDLLHGHGAPGSATGGTDGDYYIDDDTLTLYGPLTAGNWGTGVAMTYAETSYHGRAYTYNPDGTVNTITDTVNGAVTTYAYNGDGTIHTETRSLNGNTLTLTYAYNPDGTISGIT